MLSQPLNPLLKIFSLSYSKSMHLRSSLYQSRKLSCWIPPIPCISVGNISWGGSGKTPLCQVLMGWAVQNGLNPVLLSRGYKASPPKLPYRVSPESQAKEAGDEPLLLARLCPQARVYIDPKRKRAGKISLKKDNPDLFIMDDAFQHLSMQRDLNLLLFKDKDLKNGWNKVIPLGTWREGKQALQRADAFLLPQNSRASLQENENELLHLQKPIFCFDFRPSKLVRVLDGLKVHQIEENYLLVSGVGEPERLEKSVCNFLARSPLSHLKFRDHHAYSPRDWRKIKKIAEGLGCKLIVCTSKDGVKLEKYADQSLFFVEAEIKFCEDGSEFSGFWTWLKKEVQKAQQKKSRGIKGSGSILGSVAL